jgi:hypothetical protein
MSVFAGWFASVIEIVLVLLIVIGSSFAQPRFPPCKRYLESALINATSIETMLHNRSFPSATEFMNLF